MKLKTSYTPNDDVNSWYRAQNIQIKIKRKRIKIKKTRKEGRKEKRQLERS